MSAFCNALHFFYDHSLYLYFAHKHCVCELNLVPLSATCFLNISVDNDNFPPSPPLSVASLTYLGALPVLTLISVSLKMHSVD